MRYLEQSFGHDIHVRHLESLGQCTDTNVDVVGSHVGCLSSDKLSDMHMNTSTVDRRTSLTNPNTVRTERAVACQNVKKTGRCVRTMNSRDGAEASSPTALIANSFNSGLWGASSTLTTMYTCNRQYIATVTESDTTTVIYRNVSS